MTMRVLFDVNVLIAILDHNHVHHRITHEWWAANQSHGWASCPLTQNGMVRVMSQPAYKNPITTTFALELLGRQIVRTDHAFWADHISLLDVNLIDRDQILGPNQITDIYLLALAVKNGGRLATLDRAIPLSAVHAAEARHLALIR